MAVLVISMAVPYNKKIYIKIIKLSNTKTNVKKTLKKIKINKKINGKPIIKNKLQFHYIKNKHNLHITFVST